MSGHQQATIGDNVYFWFASNDTSGSGGDGSTPLFDVREAGAAAGAIPLLSGTPTLLTHANYPSGAHEIAVVATVGNGFAANDTFGVFCTLLVDSQNPTGFVGSCTLTPLAKTSEISALNNFDPANDDVAVVTLTATTTDVTNQVSANVTSISGGSAAADNLEAMYDGNGYVDDTAPSSRAQVDGIGAAAGAALPKEATSDNATVAIEGVSKVGTQTGIFTNTEAEDGNYHVITHAANDIDWIYGFEIGGNRTAVSISFAGYLTGSNDAMFIQAFDFVGSDWETLSQLPGQAGSSNIPLAPDLLSKHTGTGVDIGKVYIRFVADGAMSSPILNTDKLIVNAVNIGQSVGYSGGSIWIDTLLGTSGAEPFVNGVADKPVDNLTDALSLSVSTSLRRFQIVSGSTVNLIADASGMVGIGENWNLGLEGQLITNSVVIGANITGNADITSIDSKAIDCCFDTDGSGVGLTPSTNIRCGFKDEITLLAVGTYTFVQWFSEIPGEDTPGLNFNPAIGACFVNLRIGSGGIEIKNMKAGDVLSLEGFGQLVIASTCEAGTIAIRGNYIITDNVVGGFVAGGGVISDSARYDTGQIDDTITANASIIDIIADTNELQTNQGDWATATGFATETKQDIMQGNVTDILSDTGTTLDGKLENLLEALVYKQIITEANGDTEIFNVSNVSQGTVTTAFTSDGTFTQRLKMVI